MTTATSGAPAITVVVADDHPIYRDGVARAIDERPEFDLVGVAADGIAALDLIRRARPRVALLDVQMPARSGVDVLRAVRGDSLPTAVVLLSAHVEPEVVYRAMADGASAFLGKEASRDRICGVIAAAARGETVLDAEAQRVLAAEIRRREHDARPPLSAREQEVLELIADGLTAPDIGGRLHLSNSTVKTYLRSLYEKLGVSDRAAAVAEAMRRGLID